MYIDKLTHFIILNLFADEYRHLRVHVRAYLDYGAEKSDAARATVEQETVSRSGKCCMYRDKVGELLMVLRSSDMYYIC